MLNINFNFNTTTKTTATTTKTTTITTKPTPKWEETEVKINGRDERVHSSSFSLEKMGWMQRIEDPETGIELESPYFVGEDASCVRFNLLQSLETFRRNLSYQERWAMLFDSPLTLPEIDLGDATWRIIRYLKYQDQRDPRVEEIRNIWNNFIRNVNKAVKDSKEKIDFYKTKIDRLEAKIKELKEQLDQ